MLDGWVRLWALSSFVWLAGTAGYRKRDEHELLAKRSAQYVRENLSAAQIRVVAVGAAIWAGPSLTILALGFAVRWVARGFRGR